MLRAILRRAAVCIAIAFSFSPTLVAQTSNKDTSQSPPVRVAVAPENAEAAKRDDARLELERQRVELDKERTSLERQKLVWLTWLAVIPGWITALGIVGGGMFALWRFR